MASAIGTSTPKANVKCVLEIPNLAVFFQDVA